MPRLSPQSWQLLAKIFELDGFSFDRTRGDHNLYKKPGHRTVSIPRYDQVDLNIIKSNMRSAAMDRDRYFELLRQVSGQKKPTG